MKLSCSVALFYNQCSTFMIFKEVRAYYFQNWPVYVACTESESEMQWRVHTALDVAEDRLAAGARASDLRDLYLGLLYSTEAHNM